MTRIIDRLKPCFKDQNKKKNEDTYFQDESRKHFRDYSEIKVILLFLEARNDAHSFSYITQCSNPSAVLGHLWNEMQQVILNLLCAGS